MELPQFLGGCAGVKLYTYPTHPPNEAGDHVGFKLLIEDDGTWHEKDFSMSVFWMEDLIEELDKARAYLKTLNLDKWGRLPIEKKPV